MRKKVIKITLMLILILALVTVCVCWRKIFDASINSPNLISCKSHVDIDLDMICDNCGVILDFSDYSEHKIVETISNGGSSIKIEGNMFENTIVKASEIERESAITLTKKYVKDISDEDIICAYDISMISSDIKFQPENYGEVVKVNISDLDIPIKSNMALLHIFDDENYEILPLDKFSNNEIEFRATKFSTYILISLGSYDITFSGDGDFKILDINGVEITNGKTITGGTNFSFSIVPSEDYELREVTLTDVSGAKIEEAGDGFGKTCVISNIVSNVTVNIETLALPEITLNPASVKIKEGTSTSFSTTSADAAKFEWQYREDSSSEWKSVLGVLGYTSKNGNTSILNTGSVAEEKSGYQIRCLAYASTDSDKPRISDTALLVTMQNVITVDVKLSGLPNAPIIMPSRESGVWGKTDVTFTMAVGGVMEDEQILQYRINGGEWIDYSGEVTVSNNGITMVYGRAINATRPEFISEEAVIEVRNDKTLPTVELISQGNSKVYFKVQDTDSGIAFWGVTSSMNEPKQVLTEVLESGDKLDYWYPIENTTSEVLRTFEGLSLGSYYIWAKDLAGNVSTPVDIVVYKDIMAPFGSIKVVGNDVDGVTYVNNTEVTLKLTAKDNETSTENIKMKLYNKEEFENIVSLDDIVWENFADEVTWTLPNNNGLRRIYMLLKDEAGNVSLSLK